MLSGGPASNSLDRFEPGSLMADTDQPGSIICSGNSRNLLIKHYLVMFCTGGERSQGSLRKLSHGLYAEIVLVCDMW